jgi:hypothetical protein
VITLSDMTASESVSASGADVLRNIAATGQSFLVYALPRNAGKTTLATAILAEAPSNVQQRQFLGTTQEVAALSTEPNPGYLIVNEIGHRGRPGYLAGHEVVRVFELVAKGWALASSLHADTVDEVFDVLGRNGVDPASARQVPYLIKVSPLGDPFDPATQRVVNEIHELASGTAATTLLYHS